MVFKGKMENQIGSNAKVWHKGGCHCGAVKFRAFVPRDNTITICNCSICEVSGYQHLFVAKEEFELLTDWDAVSIYTFGSHTAQHYFCKTCGVKSFYVPRSHPDGYSLNLHCMDKNSFGNLTFRDFDGRNWENNILKLRSGI